METIKNNCPKCKSSAIREQPPKWGAGNTATSDCWCNQCGTFWKLVYRPVAQSNIKENHV